MFRRYLTRTDSTVTACSLTLLDDNGPVMYQSHTVHPPNLEEIEQISSELKLGISKQDAVTFQALITTNLKAYDVMEKYVEPTLPVKYPRTPGYRPPREDNKYNAWYYKTDIAGAPEGPLKGRRVAVRDSFPVAGVPMMHGSRMVEGFVPDYDPTVITRILDAGGNISGKAVCENFGIGGNSFNSSPFPVLNPHDTTRTAGGASSGCAVLVQTGECDMAVAGDQSGALRIPCSWCGVVGMKPTYGLVPYTGLLDLCPALDVCGPVARTVKDCALLLEVIAGDDDGLDMRQRRIPDQKDLPKYSQLLNGDVSGVKIGLLMEAFQGCEQDVCETVTLAARRLTEKGASVDEVSIPMHTDGSDYKTLVLPTHVHGSYSIFLGQQGFGPPSYYPTSAMDNYFSYAKTRPQHYSNSIKVAMLQGKYLLDNYGMHFYAKSQNLLRLLKKEYDQALEKYDVLVMPTMKHKAPKLPEAEISVTDYVREGIWMFTNTAPFSGTGHPAITINAGFSDQLPVGMQIVGRHLADDLVLNVAYAYEQLLRK